MMAGEALEHALDELRNWSSRTGPELRAYARERGVPVLEDPDLATVVVLKQRTWPDIDAVVLTVLDQAGPRWMVTKGVSLRSEREFLGSGSTRPDQGIKDRREPYLKLTASFHYGQFFAAGRLYANDLRSVRCRLVWPDRYVLEDDVKNGVVIFYGERDRISWPAVEILDAEGSLIATHPLRETTNATFSQPA